MTDTGLDSALRARESLAAAAGDATVPPDVAAVVRTPEERFAEVAGFPYEPCYRFFDGLRLAHIDVGEGAPVVLLHGSPTWSYLWRGVIPQLCEAGYRCIVPDQIGYGRSDKPTDLRWYSYDRFVAASCDLLDGLDLHGATMVAHDWGVPVGLRVVAERPDRVVRVAAMDGTLPLGQAPSEAWHVLRAFVEQTPDLPISPLVEAGCTQPLHDGAAAAYEAPFPGPEFKVGPRSGPLLRPTSPTHPDAIRGRQVLDELRSRPRPTLLLWGEDDPVMPPAVGDGLARSLGCAPPTRIPGAGHFVPEDQPARVAAALVDWLAGF